MSASKKPGCLRWYGYYPDQLQACYFFHTHKHTHTHTNTSRSWIWWI